ncbi:MAG: M48 family metallopeptidase [Candidatus Latescibacterota bacterium]
MNIYVIIILLALLLDYFLNLLADILNLRKLSGEIPPDFSDVYDRETYRKSQEYTRAKTRFGIFVSTVSLAALLVFWFFGGFNWLDIFVRSWRLNQIVTGIVYIALLLLIKELFSLPFSAVDTFVIEERFGFNRTKPATFFTDLLKGLALAILLGGPILAVVLVFFEKTGVYAWLYCWVISTIFTLILQFIAPTWIMPLFNKFKPLEEGELKNGILDYAKSVDFPLTGVFVMDGSRRSSKSNAFFTGFGRNKRIALFDTLIAKHSIPELIAILAHEIGHYKKKHVIQGMIISIFHAGFVFFLLSLFLGNQTLFQAFLMAHVSVYAGLIFFGLLYTPVELILSLLLNLLSRHNEYEADRFAVRTIPFPSALITALKNLAAHNLTNLSPHPFHVFLNYSHPPLPERIGAIEKRLKNEG